MQTSFLRTLIVCGACIHVAGTLSAEVAAFPLLITAMTSHVRGRAELARVATQLVSHVVSAVGAATVILWLGYWLALGQGGAACCLSDRLPVPAVAAVHPASPSACDGERRCRAVRH